MLYLSHMAENILVYFIYGLITTIAGSANPIYCIEYFINRAAFHPCSELPVHLNLGLISGQMFLLATLAS